MLLEEHTAPADRASAANQLKVLSSAGLDGPFVQTFANEGPTRLVFVQQVVDLASLCVHLLDERLSDSGYHGAATGQCLGTNAVSQPPGAEVLPGLPNAIRKGADGFLDGAGILPSPTRSTPEPVNVS